MKEKIGHLVAELKPNLIGMRRAIHRHAETGWTEFWTAAYVVKKLKELGLEVSYSSEVIKEEAMMGVPSAEILAACQKRAVEQGADPDIVAKMEGGKTGVVAVLDTGRPGPTVGFRFDMDANDVEEAKDRKHRPFAEGFASLNEGTNHACGHDAHTAIGLGIAQVLLTIENDLKGKVKFIFQPAEEGVRGAKAMMEAGVVDDVDYMIGFHVGSYYRKLGQVACGGLGSLATTKIDVYFTGGNPATAGAEPEAGRNALLAAHTAGLNLHAISRHSGGATRINVGTLVAGTGRNVIPAWAEMKMETRGETTELNEYMFKNACRILEAAAAMHDVQVKIKIAGSAPGMIPSEGLVKKLAEIASAIPDFTEVMEYGRSGGSEDYTYFVQRVQQLGGEATYALLGTELAAGHHHYYFDINEDVIPLGVRFFSEAARNITNTLSPLK